MSQYWQSKIASMAREQPTMRFQNMARYLTPFMLDKAYSSLNRKAVPGPDGVDVSTFEQEYSSNIMELHRQLKDDTWRATPARKVLIPKSNGKKRPLAVANLADRVIHKSIAMVLETVYEQDFEEFSYGFRPGRGAKDALEDLRVTIDRKRVNYVLEADIKSFFDEVQHSWLREFLKHRIDDRRLLNLINRILKAGVMYEGRWQKGTQGVPQGSPLSPLLANIYLHYVLDQWYSKRMAKRIKGFSRMIRYADDFVVCFERRKDAEDFRRELEKRLGEFGLSTVPEKTRLIRIRRKPGKPKLGKEDESFDFLGMCIYRRQQGKGAMRTALKPSSKSRRKFLSNVNQWLRAAMHASPNWQGKRLSEKLKGFYNYFLSRWGFPVIRMIKSQVERRWLKVLNRRSQRDKLTWKKIKHKPWFKLPNPERPGKRKSKFRPKRPLQLELWPSRS